MRAMAWREIIHDFHYFATIIDVCFRQLGPSMTCQFRCGSFFLSCPQYRNTFATQSVHNQHLRAHTRCTRLRWDSGLISEMRKQPTCCQTWSKTRALCSFLRKTCRLDSSAGPAALLFDKSSHLQSMSIHFLGHSDWKCKVFLGSRQINMLALLWAILASLTLLYWVAFSNGLMSQCPETCADKSTRRQPNQPVQAASSVKHSKCHQISECKVFMWKRLWGLSWPLGLSQALGYFTQLWVFHGMHWRWCPRVFLLSWQGLLRRWADLHFFRSGLPLCASGVPCLCTVACRPLALFMVYVYSGLGCNTLEPIPSCIACVVHFGWWVSFIPNSLVS